MSVVLSPSLSSLLTFSLSAADKDINIGHSVAYFGLIHLVRLAQTEPVFLK